MQPSICLFIAFVSAINAHPEEKTVGDLANKWINIINNDPNSTWKAGQNFNPDTPIRYLESLIGVRDLDHNLAELDPYESIEDNNEYVEVPKYFDSRKKWKECQSLQEIRDQGNCGSCWAVSVAAAFADRLCIASKGKWNKHISSRELMSCCSDCGNGCKGGYTEEAWLFIKNHGLITGGDFDSHDGCQPYPMEPCEHHIVGPRPNCSAHPLLPTPPCETKCTNGPSEAYEKERQKGESAYPVPPNKKAIQLEILKNGPTVAVFEVYDDFCVYKSGVYKPHPESIPLGFHAVKLIGWGEQNGVPYWLVQNSWNYDWGDKGLFKILHHECGFEKAITAGLPYWKN